MSRQLIQYRIFIGSPGRLQEEREAFRHVLTKFNEHHGEPAGTLFAAVGWEDTLVGVGRPQELINDDLRTCDFAVFVLHDRWGSPTGNGKSSGTEEEWELAQELYEKKIIRKICLFFKDVDPKKLADPGPQLQKVLDFKLKIEREKKHFFRAYGDISGYRVLLEKHVASWMREVSGNESKEILTLAPTSVTANPSASLEKGPSFNFWLDQSRKFSDPNAGIVDGAGAHFCAQMALKLANTDLEWADAENARGLALLHLKELAKAFECFEMVGARFLNPGNAALRVKCARALYNKGFTLGELGRSQDAIEAYDEVLERFENEFELQDFVARAMFNKGIMLNKLGQKKNAIVAYDAVIAGFEKSSGTVPREMVAKALINKGLALKDLKRNEAAIAVYNDLIERFRVADESAIRKLTERARVLRLEAKKPKQQ